MTPEGAGVGSGCQPHADGTGGNADGRTVEADPMTTPDLAQEFGKLMAAPA
jgi:hypothetical protein